MINCIVMHDFSLKSESAYEQIGNCILFCLIFLGAKSRFPLYLLFRFATQKDAVAIGARVQSFLQCLSLYRVCHSIGI